MEIYNSLKGKTEKDLGVLFTESLSFEKHVSNTLNKANMIIGLIRRKFTHIDNTLFLTLYKSLINQIASGLWKPDIFPNNQKV